MKKKRTFVAVFSQDLIANDTGLQVSKRILNCVEKGMTFIFKKIFRAILTSNVFHFRKERWFKQIKGVAMRSSILLFVASVYMYERIRSAGIARSPLPAQLLYLRQYIDDFVGIILGGGLPEVQALFCQVENEHIQLTFVVPPRRESLEALDLRLSIVDGRVVTKLYRKPTDGTRRFVH